MIMELRHHQANPKKGPEYYREYFEKLGAIEDVSAAYRR